MFFCLVWLPCLLWFRPCAPSLEVVTFSLAPSWGPLGGQVFVGFPLGLAWVVCFGVPPFLTPGCLWFAVGLFVPGGGRAPRASRRHGVVSCGRCLLLAWALLAAGAAAFAAPTSLRCLFGGSSDQSPHNQKEPPQVFCNTAIESATIDKEVATLKQVHTKDQQADRLISFIRFCQFGSAPFDWCSYC